MKNKINLTVIFLIFLSLIITKVSLASENQVELKDKVILVTGGATGIGAEIVKLALKRGAKIILHYNYHQKQAENLAKAGKDTHVKLIRQDLSKEEGANKLWQEAVTWNGKVDVLINNAGYLDYVSDEMNYHDRQKLWHKTMQINLFAATDLCYNAIGHFKAHKSPGIIINISSLAGFVGYRQMEGAPYAASKAALIALTRTIARSYGKEKIYAYAIAPGFTETSMIETYRHKFGDEMVEKVRNSIPTKEFVKAQEVAEAVLFLATGKAPQSTGMTWDLNGSSYVH